MPLAAAMIYNFLRNIIEIHQQLMKFHSVNLNLNIFLANKNIFLYIINSHLLKTTSYELKYLASSQFSSKQLLNQ